MLYKLKMELAFETEKEPKSVLNKVKQVISKAVKRPSSSGMLDQAFVELHKCYHDETPAKPCEVIERIDL